MATVLLWIGIALTVIGWLALARQAAKRMAAKDELAKFPQKRQVMMLRRSYCLLTILVGILILVISLIV
ncbi:MAG: hypothetical protein K2K84_02125 [Muribaculaceae bacterium]|nr:hypothetical protein [Muribaculaceae bacterium]